MANKWKIVHKDTDARNEHKICCYCKRFYCTFHSPHSYMLCSGFLPHWKWLYRLMRKISVTDTCKNFEMHKLYKQKMDKYQKQSR